MTLRAVSEAVVESPEPVPPVRRHDLDALRAFAMLLGIALHATLSFVKVPWLVQDRNQHELFGLFVVVVHGFRMPLFFMMSGYFTAMLWRRRGLRGLIRHRARRVVLPLALSCVTILPMILGLMVLAGADPVAPGGTPPAELTSAGGLRDGWRFLTEFPFFAHLWFLWHLCWMVAGFVLLVLVGRAAGLRAPPAWAVRSPCAWVWIVPLTALPQAAMHHWGTVPGFGADLAAGLIPVPTVLLYNAVFFFFGAAYHEADDAEGRLGRWWWAHLALAALVFVPGMGLALLLPEFTDAGTAGGRHLFAVLFQVLYTWLMLFGLLGLCRMLLQSTERPGVRWISDSSYWLYLAHLPLIVGGQLLMRDWAMPALAKFALLLSVSTVVLLVSYRYLVRYTWLGRLLNGPRERPV